MGRRRPQEAILQRRHTSHQRETRERTGSMLLIIPGIQFKPTMSWHLTPVRVAIIPKPTKEQRYRGCGEKGTLLHCRWECRLVQPLCKTGGRVLKRRKIHWSEALDLGGRPTSSQRPGLAPASAPARLCPTGSGAASTPRAGPPAREGHARPEGQSQLVRGRPAPSHLTGLLPL